MEPRMKSVGGPEVFGGIGQLLKAVQAGGVDPRLLSMIHLRVSQINSCAPCAYSAIASAKKAGETDERLHAVATWRETPFFSDEERAAFALAEAATRIQDNAPGVTDPVWDAAADHFTEAQLGAIVLEIGLTNMFNRINHTTREQAGKTW